MDLPGLHHQAVPVYESDGLAKYLGNDPYDRSHPSRGLRNDPHDRNGPFRGLGSDFDARRRYSIDKLMIIKGIILYL